MSSKKQIERLQMQRQQLIEKLLLTQQMIRGHFNKAYRQCGKTNCWCVEGQGHPINRISWTQRTLSRSKTIPLDQIAWAKTMTANYKRFRKTRQTLREIDKRLNTLLDELEEKIINKTKKGKTLFQ